METKDYVTLGLAVIGFAAGLWPYNVTSRNTFLAPIRQAQLDLYRQASSAASRLSTLSPNGDEWNQARNEFRMLYYGPLAMVENYRHTSDNKTEPPVEQEPTVEQAMIAFNSCLENPT